MRAIAQLLHHRRDLRLLISANLVSLCGDWILRVGLAYHVYDLTGSPLASAGMMLATFVPYVVVSSFAGVFVDRWSRKQTLVVTNVLHTAGLAPLLLVQSSADVWIVYAVTVMQALIAVFFTPAEQALLPTLVADDELPLANAVNGQVREVARLAGPAVGGLAISTGGVTALAALDAATFIAAAVLIAAITPDPGRQQRDDVSPRTTSTSREWIRGLALAAGDPAVRIVFLFTLLAMIGEGVMGTLFAPFVHDVLGGSAAAFGLLVACQAVGGIAGGIFAATLSRSASPASMFGAGAIGFGLVDLVMFVYPVASTALWPAVICMLVVGVPGAVSMVGYNTVLQRGTSDAYRGRIYGALGVVQGVGVVSGTVIAGLLAERVGIVAVIVVQGLVPICGGLIVLLTLRPVRAERLAS